MSPQNIIVIEEMDNCLFNLMEKYGYIKQSLVLSNGEQLVVKWNCSLWVCIMC